MLRHIGLCSDALVVNVYNICYYFLSNNIDTLGNVYFSYIARRVLVWDIFKYKTQVCVLCIASQLKLIDRYRCLVFCIYEVTWIVLNYK